MKRIVLEYTFETSSEYLWELIVDPEHYRYWTTAFSEGSKFIGNWTKGSTIHFVMIDDEGNESGMLSEVMESEWPNRIFIQHKGLVMNGIEDYESPQAKLWTPAYENYTMKQIEGGKCTFKMEQTIPEAFEDEFLDNWHHAFKLMEERLKLLPDLNYRISLEAYSKHSPSEVWKRLTNPELVKTWNYASPDWHCPLASNSLRIGGEFHYEMAARDGSISFDFWGTYDEIEVDQTLGFTLGDGRKVSIHLIEKPWGALILEHFEPERDNSLHLQRQGWQAILNHLAGEAVL